MISTSKHCTVQAPAATGARTTDARKTGARKTKARTAQQTLAKQIPAKQTLAPVLGNFRLTAGSPLTKLNVSDDDSGAAGIDVLGRQRPAHLAAHRAGAEGHGF